MPQPALPIVLGSSVAAIETSILLPELGIAFDMGVCRREAIAASHVFLTHGHVDHCGAVALHASARSVNGLPAARYVSPVPCVPALERTFSAYDELGDFALPRVIEGAVPGAEFTLRKGLVVRAFATDHRVPSVGYVIVERKERLDPRHAGRSGPEIAAMRAAGEVVTRIEETPWVAISGDTRIEAIERCDEARRARLLILEATYLTPDQPVWKARERGHIHLDEIVDRAAMFENERIVLMHFSARYSDRQIARVLATRLPDELRDRVRPLQ